MGIKNLQSLSLVKRKQSKRRVGYSPPYSRFNSYRLKKSKRFKQLDRVVLSRLSLLLKELLEQIDGLGGCLAVSFEFDQELVRVGEMPDFFKLTRTEEGSLFRGKTIKTEKYYIEPISIDNYVIGYIYLAMSERAGVDSISELIKAHAKIVSKELELTLQKKSMDQYFTQLMKKKEELEKVQQYNKSLISITTHDISSPLNAVSGYLDLMEECLQEEMDVSRIQHYRRQIHSGIQDISDIVTQISEINHLKWGQKPLDFINVDINWIVTDICKRMEIEAAKRGKLLKVTTVQRSAHAKIDISKLKRILYNLITNGIKYTRDDGIITVDTYLEEDRVYVKIADNGIGISEEDQQRIFEPFTKLSKSESDGDASCGLGLFVSSYFTKRMGGRIEVKSKLDAGSEFLLSFPHATDNDMAF